MKFSVFKQVLALLVVLAGQGLHDLDVCGDDSAYAFGFGAIHGGGAAHQCKFSFVLVAEVTCICISSNIGFLRDNVAGKLYKCQVCGTPQ